MTVLIYFLTVLRMHHINTILNACITLLFSDHNGERRPMKFKLIVRLFKVIFQKCGRHEGREGVNFEKYSIEIFKYF